MKYSLKNRQFRKRSNIFGERKKEEELPDFIIRDLEAIKQSLQESEESKCIPPRPTSQRNSKLWKFINFEDDSSDVKGEFSRKDIKKYSLEARPNRHGLSPVHKPILDNPQIRLTESTVREAKSLEIESETVCYCYYPQMKPDESEELKNLLAKLYKVLIKNNERISQMQLVLLQIVQRGQLMSKQLNQGLRTVLSMEDRTNLFFNTMRSVYENLRVCKLKQQNLELYFRQSKEEKIHQQQEAIFNNLTVKYEKPKYTQSHKKQYQSIHHENQVESKELARLIDYESDSSLNQIDSVQRFTEQTSEYAPTFKRHQKSHEIQNFLDPIQLQMQPSLTENNQYEHLSPFEANRVILSTQKGTSPLFIRSQPKTTVNQSYFSTFKPTKQSQETNQYERIKVWLRASNQIGLRCWLDEMGCLRRNNNTYIFNSGGQVMTMSCTIFQRLSDEGLVVPVFDNV